MLFSNNVNWLILDCKSVYKSNKKLFTNVNSKIAIFVENTFWMDFEALFARHKAIEISGRYVPLSHIEPLLEKFKAVGEVSSIGISVLGKPLYLCRAGSGPAKILMWSQMHGNESTTTKALLDFLNLLAGENELGKQLLDSFSFFMVPMLNPDGAQTYTRENANNIDLNRDFCNLTQPESIALFHLFKQINPDYCFNLHDQRTIYGAGELGKPATMSFLSPSFNEAREYNSSRVRSIEVIVAMNEVLQRLIPGQVGRFDDSFNINCVGDTFQSHEIPTVLFEAGHFPGDYSREMTRKYVFIAIVAGLKYISENAVVDNRIDEYLNIPQNKMNFLDFVYKNVKINCDGNEKITNFAAQFSEVLEEGKIFFEALVEETDIADIIFGHQVIDAQNATYRDGGKCRPELGQKADFYLGNRQFRNGAEI